MEVYRNVIDVDRLCERDRDIHDALPHLERAKGILVKEERGILPSYQRIPHPDINIAHAAGLISDDAYREALAECGMFAKESEMHNMRNLVDGLLTYWGGGANVYLSSIWMSDDLESHSPAALTIEGGGWDYYFKPKVFRLGKSGRVLRDQNGKLYAEEVHIKTTPEMVLGGISGIHSVRLGVHTDEGVIVVKEKGEYVDSAFVERRGEFRGRFREKSNFLEIDLGTLPIPNGWTIDKHPLEERLRDYEGGIYIFETSFDDWRDLFSYVSAISENIVWKALQLYQHCWEESPDSKIGNNFIWRAYDLPRNYWTFYETKARVDLGRTGREVRIADNYDREGLEWLSNWQTQYLTLKFGRTLLLPAIFSLEGTLKRVALDKSQTAGSGFQVFYDVRDANITPENPLTIPERPANERKGGTTAIDSLSSSFLDKR